MKAVRRLAFATGALLAFFPALAFAAEGGEQQGSWVALIFYIINFSLFVWLIRRYGGPQITEFFRNRARTIRHNISEATAALEEARKLEARARGLAAGLEAEKRKLAADIDLETAHQSKRIEEMAREAIQRIQRDHELSLAALREAGQRRVRAALAAAAETMARELVERDFKPTDQVRLLGGFVARLAEEAGR